MQKYKLFLNTSQIQEQTLFNLELWSMLSKRKSGVGSLFKDKWSNIIFCG